MYSPATLPRIEIGSDLTNLHRRLGQLALELHGRLLGDPPEDVLHIEGQGAPKAWQGQGAPDQDRVPHARRGRRVARWSTCERQSPVALCSPADAGTLYRAAARSSSPRSNGTTLSPSTCSTAVRARGKESSPTRRPSSRSTAPERTPLPTTSPRAGFTSARITCAFCFTPLDVVSRL